MRSSHVLTAGISALVSSAITVVVFIWVSSPVDPPRNFHAQSNSSTSEKFVARIDRAIKPISRAPASDGTFDRVRTIADALAFEADFDQTVAIYLLLANADEELVLDLLQQAESISPLSQKEAAFSIIYSKYAAIDPERALANAEGLPSRLQNRVLMNIFHEWARNDLESALTGADSLEGNRRQTASYVILTSRDDLEPFKRTEIAERFNLERQLASLNFQSWYEEAIQNPRWAWQEIQNSTDKKSEIRQRRSVVARAWIREEGVGVLDEMLAALSESDDKKELISSLMSTLLQIDPERTMDVISTLPNAQDVINLRERAFYAWSRRDPGAAVEQLARVDFHNKGRLMDSVLSEWGIRDPRKLLEFSETLPETWFDTAKRHALMGLARTSPEEAISYLDDIRRVGHRLELEDEIARFWSEDDPRSALEWFLSRDDYVSRPYQARKLMANFADEDPVRALQIASQYTGELGSSMISGVFAALAEKDPQQALRHLPNVNVEHKSVAVGRIGLMMAGTDLIGALNLGNLLSKEDRSRYEKRIIDQQLGWEHSRVMLLSDFNDLPSRELKVHTAIQLFHHDVYDRFLSEQERRKLHSVLSVKERKQLDETLQSMRNPEKWVITSHWFLE